MQVKIHNRCSDYASYRAARVKSLFNAEDGCNFHHEADLPIEDAAWRLGLIVGPSGSGKTSIGKALWGPEAFYTPEGWPADAPIVDGIAPKGDFNEVTGALSAVGLGDVPTWLRPYAVLSNGEKFRADLARVIAERPARVVIDEFTSVVDRQIAKMGAMAFSKSWKRGVGQCVLLSCHYDIREWLEPDWVYDTQTRTFLRGSLWRRPTFELAVWHTDGSHWPAFEPHHYLKMPRMVAAEYFVGTVEGERVCHLAVAPKLESQGMRACRMVVMPEWQGAGIGMRFLNAICQWHIDGHSRYGSRPRRVYFHTSHPGLCAALRRDKRWVQVSARMHGDSKARSRQSLAKSAKLAGVPEPGGGFGGHFRAVQGFSYLGERK